MLLRQAWSLSGELVSSLLAVPRGAGPAACGMCPGRVCVQEEAIEEQRRRAAEEEGAAAALAAAEQERLEAARRAAQQHQEVRLQRGRD
jgi:hypothetical protein